MVEDAETQDLWWRSRDSGCCDCDVESGAKDAVVLEQWLTMLWCGGRCSEYCGGRAGTQNTVAGEQRIMMLLRGKRGSGCS